MIKTDTLRGLAPGAELRPHRLVLIPYYAWAHRGEGEMVVWLFELPLPSPVIRQSRAGLGHSSNR
ncbi:MAG: hypothetical protein IMZ46_07955 [Acidobacteria bacterium]|nr:hypothetical protein [Acidobacteriota bacterium]